MGVAFFAAWGVMLLLVGSLVALLTHMATSERFSRYWMSPPQRPALPPRLVLVNTMFNNTLSLIIYAVYFFFLGDKTLYAGWPGTLRCCGEVLGVLLLYDFMYYFFHRFMHLHGVMRLCHAVHHRVRSPTSAQSIFLHPLELIGGLGLLVLSIAVLGPISAISFLLIFMLHSVANVVTHANLCIPHPAFRAFNALAARHRAHHQKLRCNYASLFPFWDRAFGTHGK